MGKTENTDKRSWLQTICSKTASEVILGQRMPHPLYLSHTSSNICYTPAYTQKFTTEQKQSKGQYVFGYVCCQMFSSPSEPVQLIPF